jgi:feruloyl esterase
MKIGPLTGVVVLLALGGFDAAPRVAAAGPLACESLGQMLLANGTLISAATVQAGEFTPPTPRDAADLTRFFSRGGKLLMYHGWADSLVTPDASLIMYKRINDAVGSAATNSLALFMVPGMGHCQGGPGTDVFDKVGALDQWIESGRKPQSIVASHMTAGIADRTRPLCAYPAVARYIGSGSTDDARNFRCQAP